LNLTNTAQTLLVANALTRGAFKVDLPTFVGLSSNFDGSYTKGNNSDEITAREILNFALGGTGGIGTGYAAGRTRVGAMTGAIAANIRSNAPTMVASVVAIPLAFKVGKQLLAKPVINPVNRGLKMIGLTGVKV
jgi:hypothetical protein